MSTQSNERRRSYRVAIDGSGFLWQKQRLAGHYMLGDISIGGCLLQHGPPCELDRDYRLVLHVPERGAMRLPVRIVRLRYGVSGACELGVCFTAHPPATEDRIHDLVMDNLERHDRGVPGRVLVAHTDEACRQQLGETLRKLGYDTVEAATPLEAVWELENGLQDFHTAFIGGVLGGRESFDLIHFMANHYPEVRRIVIDAAADLPAGAHAVLAGPVSPAGLRKVMPARATLRHLG